MRKKDLLLIIATLEDVLETATMNTADFSAHGMNPKIDIDRETLNKVIKSATKVWRETWLIWPLKEAIDKLHTEVGDNL